MQKNPGRNITKYDIASLTATPYLTALCPANLISALKKTGVFPVDPKAISGEQMAPSIIYADPQDQTREQTADSSQSKMAADSQPQSVDDGVTPSSHGDTSLTHHKHATVEPNIQTNTVSDTSTQPDFFNSRKIVTTVKTDKKKRKFVPPFLAGSLSKKSNQDVLKANAESKKRKLDSEVAKPSTSGNIATSTKKSVKVHMIEDSSEGDSEREDEVCCVCQRWQPAELQSIPGIVFVQWGKCDFCSHWTHLKFCTEVRVLRTSSKFRCPHCQ